ncbi:MAG: hypothetical protein HFH87_01330 [Lachnospiraceae bacterium]|nr:hypothetical protein [Lachnospiraceae bacterium]
MTKRVSFIDVLQRRLRQAVKVRIAERSRTEWRGRWLPSGAPSLLYVDKAATGSACYSGQGY